MDYESARMNSIPVVELERTKTNSSKTLDRLFYKERDTGVYGVSLGLDKNTFPGSWTWPCHAGLSALIQNNNQKGLTIYNLWDSLRKLRSPKDRILSEKILFEFYLGPESPWRCLFPYLRVLKCCEDIWIELKSDTDTGFSKGMQSVLTNFFIATRTPFEGHYGSGHVQINYGVTNIYRIMDTYGASYREALYLNRIFDWGIKNDSDLRLHTPDAVNKGGRVHHFLGGLPNNWLSGKFLDHNKITSFSTSGNDARLWGADPKTIRVMKSEKEKPLVKGSFARYYLPHLIGSKVETVEDYLKFLLEEVRSRYGKKKVEAK